MTEVFINLTGVFLTLTEVFPCLFLSCKANARVKLVKTGHGPHSSTLSLICIVRLLFVLSYVLFLCVNVYCHWVTTQWQLRNTSHHYQNPVCISPLRGTCHMPCPISFSILSPEKSGHGDPPYSPCHLTLR
jgi:hypothetical protein